jgi:hypothetical protein
MDGGKVGADTVEGVLHLQQGLAAAWDLPVKVVSLLVLCMHGQERRLTPGQAVTPTTGASSRGGGAALEGDLIFDPQPPERLPAVVDAAAKQ